MKYILGPRQYSAPLAENGYLPVRIIEDARECVVFLGWQLPGPVDTAPIDPKGTGFLMALQPGSYVLVTARHVAEKLIPPFVIRMNKKGGGANLMHVERPGDMTWCIHPTDNSIDLAVAPIEIPSWADVVAYPATSEYLGDDVRQSRFMSPGRSDLCSWIISSSLRRTKKYSYCSLWARRNAAE